MSFTLYVRPTIWLCMLECQSHMKRKVSAANKPVWAHNEALIFWSNFGSMWVKKYCVHCLVLQQLVSSRGGLYCLQSCMVISTACSLVSQQLVSSRGGLYCLQSCMVISTACSLVWWSLLPAVLYGGLYCLQSCIATASLLS